MKPIEQQVILVTGATDGIGKQTAHNLAQMGATVLIHGRNRERAQQTLQEIQSATGNGKLSYYLGDFSSLVEVRNMTESIIAEHSALDALINNAGIGGGSPTENHHQLSQDGYELRFAVNYLAPFLLTKLLLPLLRNAAPSRIVNVSSAGQQTIDFDDVMLEHHYDGGRAYRQSKLAQIMFTIDLAEQLKDNNITVNCLHPGTYLNTKMVHESQITPLGEPQSGADAIIYLATSPKLDGVTGRYFDQKRESRANAQAYDAQARQKLWQLSEELTKLN